MPLSEFECTVCGERFEVIMKAGEDALGCRVCGGVVQRLVGSTSFRLAGSGWAKDNYAGEKK